MMADVITDGNEILATFLAWMVLRKRAKGDTGVYNYGLGEFKTLAGYLPGLSCSSRSTRSSLQRLTD